MQDETAQQPRQQDSAPATALTVDKKDVPPRRLTKVDLAHELGVYSADTGITSFETEDRQISVTMNKTGLDTIVYLELEPGAGITCDNKVLELVEGHEVSWLPGALKLGYISRWLTGEGMTQKTYYNNTNKRIKMTLKAANTTLTAFDLGKVPQHKIMGNLGGFAGSTYTAQTPEPKIGWTVRLMPWYGAFSGGDTYFKQSIRARSPEENSLPGKISYFFKSLVNPSYADEKRQGLVFLETRGATSLRPMDSGEVTRVVADDYVASSWNVNRSVAILKGMGRPLESAKNLFGYYWSGEPVTGIKLKEADGSRGFVVTEVPDPNRPKKFITYPPLFTGGTFATGVGLAYLYNTASLASVPLAQTAFEWVGAGLGAATIVPSLSNIFNRRSSPSSRAVAWAGLGLGIANIATLYLVPGMPLVQLGLMTAASAMNLAAHFLKKPHGAKDGGSTTPPAQQAPARHRQSGAVAAAAAALS